MNDNLDAKMLGRLGKLDSCSIANAVDSLRVRLLSEGSSGPGITCRTPTLPPMVGRAVTLKVRSSEPPMKEAFYLDQPDWWERLETAPFPRILVIEDTDLHPGKGSLVGPVHACILKAMGFAGIVTSGAVRGADKFEAIGLQAFSGNTSPSHAYGHVVEMGGQVEVAGVRIATGDVIHGDLNGFVSIPEDAIGRVPELAEQFREREKRVCRFCSTHDFSPAMLRRIIGADASRG
jgi:4-hydroxy-4-methyl-2-oxoglutarate aldolase